MTLIKRKLQVGNFGHIKRRNTIKKEILEGKIEGKRGRLPGNGRREDDVKTWTEMDMYT